MHSGVIMEISYTRIGEEVGHSRGVFVFKLSSTGSIMVHNSCSFLSLFTVKNKKATLDKGIINRDLLGESSKKSFCTW